MTNYNLQKSIIKSEYTRNYPDPLNQDMSGDTYTIVHHILVAKAINVPSGLPKDPNPREQKTDYGIYKDVRESLESVDLSFHLKNKGITVFAHKVEYSEDKRVATVHLAEGDGIADGAHTYEIILAAQSDGTCPEGQYVKFEIITGVPREMRVDITGGLNTAVQVQPASLANLEGKFQWVKDALNGMPYANKISFKQNLKAEYDIRDILALMTVFNVNKFSTTNHPKIAYVSKAKCLDMYLDDPESFKMLTPILKDILELYDYIQLKGKERYNAVKGGKAGKMIGIYAERKKRKPCEFHFIGAEGDQKMYDGALYPILGSLRFLVEQKPGEEVYSWKLGSFDKIKSFFDELAPELILTTYYTSLKYGLKPNPVGKDDTHWDNLYKTVALHYLSNYIK